MKLQDLKTLDELKKFIFSDTGKHYEVSSGYPFDVTVLSTQSPQLPLLIGFDEEGNIIYGTKLFEYFRKKPLFDNRQEAEQLRCKLYIEYLEKELKETKKAASELKEQS